MFAKWFLGLLLPLALLGTVSACMEDNGVQPGVVSAPASGYRGESGRVMSIREVPLRSNQSGVSNGTLIGRFETIYIVTLQAGHWGIQARSSFAS